MQRRALALAGAALLWWGPARAQPGGVERDVAGAAAILRAALGARGDPERADALLARAAREHPLIADHAERLRAELWLDEGKLDRVVEAARRGLRAQPKTPLAARLHRLEGRAHSEAGAEREARAAYEAALAERPPAALRGEVALELAGLLERAGEPRVAADRLRGVWIDLAGSEAAERAGAQLDALEARLATRLRSAGDWRRRGDALLAAGRSEEAVAAYDAALRGSLSTRERRDAQTQRAHALFRVRRYAEAAEAFGAVSAWDEEARIWRARAVARAGDVPAALRTLETLAESGPRALRPRARHLAALLADDEEPARARAYREALVRDRTASRELVAAAQWSLGWGDYRAGRFREARERWARLAALPGDPIERLQARYWEARALENLDAAAAQRAFAAIAAERPLSYYGWRAGERKPGSAPATPGRLPAGRAALSPDAFARARILLAAGLPEDARDELDALVRRASGRDDVLAIASLYAEAGDAGAGQRLVVARWSDTLASRPAPGEEEAWWLAWPLAFENDVRRSAGRGRAAVEPALVWAVMREESGYRPDVVSPAGARGLLQIMPDTGKRLAGQVGIGSFRPDALFDPVTNIRLGAFYLAELGRRFGGRTSAAVASYNAGPEAVARWIEQGPAKHDDEWVEAIPYEQTRTYVKRVLRSLHAYRSLY